MKYRIVDLETIAHPDAGNWLEPVEPDARLVDPVKIKASIESKTADRNEKLGLDPDCCRMVALGYVDVGTGDPVVDLCHDEDQETDVLRRFWASYRQHETTLVTFYGFLFDLPVLMRRSLYLGVPYPPLSIDKYRSKHIDVWQKLSWNGAIKAHGLAFYAKRFGIGTLDKVDGADVARLWAAGQYEVVRDHCLSDVGLTHALANKLKLLELR
jgi:predicted PolB exonuclease-like 3'-5' exonuclease